MSVRNLTQLAVLVLGVTALALAAILVVREGSGATAPASADAGPCDLTTVPKAYSPEREDVVLLVWADKGVAVALDGKAVISVPEDPQSFAAGEHVLTTDCAGKRQSLTLQLLPFTPAAVHAGCDALLVVGAACDGCPSTDAARKAAAKAGKESGQFAAAAAQETLEREQRTRAAHVLTDRWNALTEQYSRVKTAVGTNAPGPAASAHLRFEDLSQGFKAATSKKDPAAQDAQIRAAEETLRVFVHQARLARPDDCDFQRRLTAAL
jgi:hypothetical protein